MKILDFIHNTRTQAILAFTVLIGGGCIIVFGKASETVDNRIFDLMFLVGTFYFGSSKSGASKDEAIANLSQQPIVNNASTVNVDQTTGA